MQNLKKKNFFPFEITDKRHDFKKYCQWQNFVQLDALNPFYH